ncbi:actin binding protein [Pelomyxa schiedti]|nr:actin binding protein [Pelomyxa schiedti]
MAATSTGEDVPAEDASSFINLKVTLPGKGVTRAIRVNVKLPVSDIMADVAEKTGEGSPEHMLLLPSKTDGKRATPAKWLLPEKTFSFYEIDDGEELYYKKKIRPQKIKTVDGTIRTVMVDDTLPVSSIIGTLLGKLGIIIVDEWGIQEDGKDKWLYENQSLLEQFVDESAVIVLKKKLFMFDREVDKGDEQQVNLLYVSTRDAINEGKYPLTEEEALDLAVIEARIQLGEFDFDKERESRNPEKPKATKEYDAYVKQVKKDIKKKCLPPPLNKSHKDRHIEFIFTEYKKMSGIDLKGIKHRYVQKAQSLKTFGITTFPVKLKVGRHQKEELFGVTRDAIVRMDPVTMDVIKRYPLAHVKRCGGVDTFTVDFGNYDTDYLVMMTNQAGEISKLIAGYIDLIVKMRTEASKPPVDTDVKHATAELTEVVDATATSLPPFRSSSVPSGLRSHMSVSPLRNASGKLTIRGPLSQVVIDDIPTATQAFIAYSEELSSTPTAISRDNVGNVSALKTQIVQSYSAIKYSVAQIFNGVEDGKQMLSRQMVIENAKATMAQVRELANQAKFLSPEDYSGLSMLDAARGLVTSMAGIYGCCEDTSEGVTLSPEQRTSYQEAEKRFTAASALVDAIISGKGIADLSSSSLMIECSKNLVSSTQDLFSTAVTCSANLPDPSKKNLIAGAQQVYIPLHGALIPACKAEIVSSVQDLKSQLTNVLKDALAVFEVTERTTIAAKAQTVSEAIAALLQAAELSEPACPMLPAQVAEFVEAMKELSISFVDLKEAAGNRAKTVFSTKQVATSVCKVVARRKSLSSDVDPATRTRLLDSAKEIANLVNKLFQAAKNSAEDIENKQKQEAFLAISGMLNEATQEMIFISGKNSAATNLRREAKALLAASIANVASYKENVTLVPEAHTDKMATSSSSLADVIKSYATVVKVACKDPSSSSAQVDLLEQTQKACAVALQLVVDSNELVADSKTPATAKLFAEPAARTKAAAEAAERACQAFKEVNGQTAISEIIEELEAMVAEMDITETAITTGYLDQTIDPSAHAEAFTLLSDSAKLLTVASQDLLDAAKNNPRKLPMKATGVSECTSQVVTAAKAVVSTLPSKAQQFATLKLAKDLTRTIQELVSTGKLLTMKPNDENIQVALDLTYQKVGTGIANLLSSEVDSKEIDSAVELINEQLGLLSAVQNDKIPMKRAAERVGLSTKALSAALQQLAVSVQTNPQGISSAVKLMSSTVPPLISAVNLAAGASPNEATAGQVLEATRALVDQASSVIRLAKASGAARGSGGMNKTILDAVKSVSASIGRLLRTLGAVSNNDCEEALGVISSTIKELNNLDGVQPVTPAVAVRKIAEISNCMVEQLEGIQSVAHTDPGALGNYARGTAQQLRLLVDTTRSLTAKEVPYVPEKFLGPSEQLLAAISNINSEEIGVSAKSIQASVSGLLTAALDEAGKTDTTKEHALALRKNAAILKNLVPKFAIAAKAIVGGDSSGKEEMETVAKNFRDTTGKLLEVVTVQPAAKDALEEGKKDKIISAAREVGMNASQLILSAMSVSAKPQDTDLRGTMAENGTTAVESVKSFIRIGNGCVPGADQVESSIDSLQGTDSDLAAASMAVAVGSIADSASSIPSEKLQDMLVTQSKIVGTKIAAVEASARMHPAVVGKAAQECSAEVKEIGLLAIQMAAILEDTEMQTELINNAKALSDASLKLVQSAFSCTCNPSVEGSKEVTVTSQAATQALSQLVSNLGATSTLLVDMDEALSDIERTATQMGEITPPPDIVSYEQCKAELTNACKGITSGIRTLSAADKINLMQLGNTARGVAQVCSLLPQSLHFAQALAPTPEIGESLVTHGNALISSTHAVVKCAKKLAQEKKNKKIASALLAAFQECTKAISDLLAVAKKGAVGEQMCNEAMDSIKKVIAEIDSSMLFASAGQLESNTTSRPQELHQALLAMVQEIGDNCGRLEGAAKSSSEVQVGEAVKSVATKVGQLSTQCLEVAGAFRNTSTQQEILSAGKAAAISTQALIFASKSARGSNANGLRSLSKAAEGVSDSLGQLLRASQRALDDLSKGSKDLITAKAKISALREQFPSEIEPNKDSSPKSVVDTAKSLVALSASLTSALFSNNQDEMSRVAQSLVDQTSRLLKDTLGIHLQLPEKTTIHDKMNNSIGETVRCIESLLEVASAMATAEEPEKRAFKKKMEKASAAVAMTLQNIGDVLQQYPGGEALALEESIKEAEELEMTAERELKKCIQAIDSGSAKLLASKPVVKPKAPGAKLDQVDISCIIKDGAAAITSASSNLMKYASTAQGSRITLLRAGSVKYRSDPLWTNALIAAAQAVSAKVAALVAAAIKANPTEEEIVSTSSGVSTATAALVNATKQRVYDPSSVEQQNMANAAKSVAASTVALVTAAKKALEPVEIEESSASTIITGTGGYDWELEKQIEVEKIEAQLRRARSDMQKLRGGKS